MPKVVGMYEKSRKGLAHNMGGIFGKPKKKEVAPAPKPKGQIKDVGTETKSAIESKNEALREATKEPEPTPTPTPAPTPTTPEPEADISNRTATMAMRKRRLAFEKAEREKKKK